MINDPADDAISRTTEQLLEFSADAQIKRRETAPDTPAFHSLTGAIAAYGRVLRLLAKLRQLEEEEFLVIGPFDFAERTGSEVRPL